MYNSLQIVFTAPSQANLLSYCSNLCLLENLKVFSMSFSPSWTVFFPAYRKVSEIMYIFAMQYIIKTNAIVIKQPINVPMLRC